MIALHLFCGLAFFRSTVALLLCNLVFLLIACKWDDNAEIFLFSEYLSICYVLGCAQNDDRPASEEKIVQHFPISKPTCTLCVVGSSIGDDIQIGIRPDQIRHEGKII